MTTKGTSDEAAAQVDAEEPTEVEDLLEDPPTDMEALCLCTLLWASTEEATGVVGGGRPATSTARSMGNCST